VISQDTELVKVTNDQCASLIFFIQGYFVPVNVQHPYVAVKLLAETTFAVGL
jgi:hypothetical protein